MNTPISYYRSCMLAIEYSPSRVFTSTRSIVIVGLFSCDNGSDFTSTIRLPSLPYCLRIYKRLRIYKQWCQMKCSFDSLLQCSRDCLLEQQKSNSPLIMPTIVNLTSTWDSTTSEIECRHPVRKTGYVLVEETQHFCEYDHDYDWNLYRSLWHNK